MTPGDCDDVGMSTEKEVYANTREPPASVHCLILRGLWIQPEICTLINPPSLAFILMHTYIRIQRRSPGDSLLQFFSDKVKIKHKMTPRMNMRDLY
jgi:hypothetical protein